MSTSEQFRDHVAAVGTVAATGVQPPEEWTLLRQRLDGFTALETPMLDRLTKSVIQPETGCDIELLRAAAIAEQAPPQQIAPVTNRVVDAVLAELRRSYASVARDNYQAVARIFDSAAKQFTDAATITDVEADSAAMIDKPDKPRKAWLAAESFANQLTRLMPPLAAAAGLAGINGADTDPVLLALAADPGTAHRRRTWEAFLSRDGRCGRWSALHRLGVVIRAASLDGLEPYREPKPLERREEPVARGVTKTVIHDPESPGYRPPTIEPRRMIGGMTR